MAFGPKDHKGERTGSSTIGVMTGGNGPTMQPDGTLKTAWDVPNVDGRGVMPGWLLKGEGVKKKI